MKQFMEPEIEIMKFSIADIITSSTDDIDDYMGWDIEVP